MKIVVLLLALLPGVARASERIIGLVEVPALEKREISGGVYAPPVGPVPLYEEPKLDSKVAMIVRELSELERREHGYEKSSAVVYSREQNPGAGYWYRVAYAAGGEKRFVWLNQSNAGEYRTIQSLVMTKMTYLTDEWNQQVFERPSSTSPSAAFQDLGRRPAVRVAASELVDGELWYLVVLVGGNICSGDRTKILATGWVPAYSESGALTIWYYSRGC